MWSKCTTLSVKPSGTCTNHQAFNGLLAITHLPIKSQSKNMKSKVTSRLAKISPQHFQNANPNIMRTKLFLPVKHIEFRGRRVLQPRNCTFSVRLASLCSPVLSHCQQPLSLVIFILMFIPCIFIK